MLMTNCRTVENAFDTCRTKSGKGLTTCRETITASFRADCLDSWPAGFRQQQDNSLENLTGGGCS